MGVFAIISAGGGGGVITIGAVAVVGDFLQDNTLKKTSIHNTR